MFNRKEYDKQYYKKNKERRKEYSKQYYKKNEEHIKEYGKQYGKQYHKKNEERIKEYGKQYREKNKEAVNKAVSKSYYKLVKEVFDHYGNECTCCGETIRLLLTIDHINNDGAMHRKILGKSNIQLYHWLKKNNFPSNFQTLCYNCNIGKYKNGGVCPHKLIKV